MKIKPLELNKPAFKGNLKRNLRIGEAVLKEFNAEFPYVKSNTNLVLRFYGFKTVDPFTALNKFFNLYKNVNDSVTKARSCFNAFNKDKYKKDYFTGFLNANRNVLIKMKEEEIKDLLVHDSVCKLMEDRHVVQKDILRKFQAFNCGELSDIIQMNLIKRGIQAYGVKTEFSTPKGAFFDFDSHCFTIFALDKNADVLKPKTWGNGAVAIDPWKKIVCGAREYFEIQKNEIEKAFGAEFKSVEKYGGLDSYLDHKATVENVLKAYKPLE